MHNEEVGYSCEVCDLYPAGVRFASRSGQLVLSKVSRVFPQSYRKIPG
jgi:hypothetical protein